MFARLLKVVHRRGLPWRVTLAVLLTICPIILAVVLGLGSVAARLLRDEAERALALHSAETADAIEQWDRGIVLALQNARGLPDIVSMDPARQRPALQHMKRVYTPLENVRVTRPDGISIARTDGDSPVDCADRPWFQACIRGVPLFRQVLITRTSGIAALNLSVPIQDGDGRVIGVLTTVTGLKSLAELPQLSDPDPYHRTIVVDERGRALVHPDPAAVQSLRDLSAFPPVSRDLAARSGLLEFTDGDSRRWLAHAERLSNGWLAVSLVDQPHAMAGYARIMRTAWILAAAAVLLVSAGCWWMTFRTLRPIRQLTLGARELGAGNWHFRTPETAPGEVGLLARTFNQMAERLARVYRDIELQVQQRTAKLHTLNHELETQRNLVVHHTRQIEALLDALPGPAFLKDRNGMYVAANTQFCKLVGRPIHDVLGAADTRLFPDSAPERAAEDQCLLSGQRAVVESEVEIADGGHRAWMLHRKLPVRAPHGVIEHIVGIGFDITDLRTAQATIRQLSRAVEQAPASVVITDCQGRITFVNKSFCRLTGYTEAEVLGQNPRLVKSGLTPSAVYEELWATITQGREWRGELQNRKKNGELYWEHAVISPLLDEHGRITHFLGVKEDITQRRSMEESLRQAALLDRLTGLPNRALLLDRIQRAMLRRQRSPRSDYAVLFLDFDRFKLVNDGLGHDVGDRLLVEIAARFQRLIRASDSLALSTDRHVAARLGGDEFVILLEDLSSPSQALQVARRLQSALAEPFHIGGHQIVSSASIGLVLPGEDYHRPEDILRDADTAMYQAKQAGGAAADGRIALFNPRMRDAVRKRLDLESELREAIQCREFTLHYQPIVSLESGHIESLEALIRWPHRWRGGLAPDDFIPVAEDSGLIVPVGDWVVREAFAQLGAWWQTFGRQRIGSISVNLARQQLLVPGIVSQLAKAARDARITPDAVHLEITESAVMQDMGSSIRIMHALRSEGFKIDLDDFGTGYSSLSSLHQFPLDVLKIDRSFIANLSRGRQYAALVQAIAVLAQNLNLRVVAEGVETSDQLTTLQALDCQFAQGHLFSPAVPAEQAAQLLRTGLQPAALTA